MFKTYSIKYLCVLFGKRKKKSKKEKNNESYENLEIITIIIREYKIFLFSSSSFSSYLTKKKIQILY